MDILLLTYPIAHFVPVRIVEKRKCGFVGWVPPLALETEVPHAPPLRSPRYPPHTAPCIRVTHCPPTHVPVLHTYAAPLYTCTHGSVYPWLCVPVYPCILGIIDACGPCG